MKKELFKIIESINERVVELMKEDENKIFRPVNASHITDLIGIRNSLIHLHKNA